MSIKDLAYKFYKLRLIDPGVGILLDLRDLELDHNDQIGQGGAQ